MPDRGCQAPHASAGGRQPVEHRGWRLAPRDGVPTPQLFFDASLRRRTPIEVRQEQLGYDAGETEALAYLPKEHEERSPSSLQASGACAA